MTVFVTQCCLQTADRRCDARRCSFRRSIRRDSSGDDQNPSPTPFPIKSIPSMILCLYRKCEMYNGDKNQAFSCTSDARIVLAKSQRHRLLKFGKGISQDLENIERIVP